MIEIQNPEFKIQNCLTDFHSHLLPGLDDGAKTLDDALAIARSLAEAGFGRACCTPHRIRGAWGDVTSEQVRQGTAELQGQLLLAGIDLQLFPGREYYLDEFLADELDDPLLLPGGLLLVELPSICDPDRVRDTLFQLTLRGFKILIAHPERSPLLSLPEPEKQGLFSRLGFSDNSKSRIQNSTSASDSLILYLQGIGCRFQANLGSFAGIYGDQVQDNARRLLQAGIYTHLGSDAHTPARFDRLLGDGLVEVERLAGAGTLKLLAASEE